MNLDGIIGEGRFLIKRNRGKQEGYYVFAPFIIQSENNQVYYDEDTYQSKTHNRKLLLNLGWMPKTRKHLIFATFGSDIYGQEVYEDRNEALEK